MTVMLYGFEDKVVHDENSDMRNGRAYMDLRSIGRGFKSYAGQRCMRNNLGELVHTYASVTKQYNFNWYRPKDGDALWHGKVTAGLAESSGSYRRVDDLRSPTG